MTKKDSTFLPLVQILLATHNGQLYLAEQLNSIVNQNYSNWIATIHDDGSTDKTQEIIDAYQAKYPNQIFILKDSQVFRSAKKNFIHLLSNVNPDAELFLFCDQDDIWYDQKLTLMVDAYLLNDKNKPILIHSDLSIVDDYLKCMAPSHNILINNQKNRINKNSVLYGNPIPGCAMAFNAILLKQIKLRDNIVMHDWWILQSALYCDSLIIYLSQPLVMYRQHSNNVCGHTKSSLLKIVLRLPLRLSNYFSNAREAFQQSLYFHRQPFLLYLLNRILYQVRINY
ncbi:glycosyltransferase [Synechococcus sp. MIT S9503]|uniref:glycosyltransferase n=1 Tax=Synechococcus sp. MIT S9503 TaxID=3082547 RepID=UPI0039A5A97E